MRRWIWAGMVVLGLVCVARGAAPAPATRPVPAGITYADLLRRVVDLERLADLSSLEGVGRASSYDRTGGNADAGYFIRERDGWYVIADLEGPGAIMRTWTADALRWKQGRQKSPRLRIYVDSEESPRIDMDWQEMFRGDAFPFLPPLADDKSDCGNSYIPISYQKSCRVELSEKPGYYQLDWVRFPGGTKVEPYPAQWSPAQKQTLSEVASALLGNTAPISVQGLEEVIPIERHVGAGMTGKLFSISGPAIIKNVTLSSKPAGREHLRAAVLRMYWDNSDRPSVECPLGDFFGTSPGVNLYRTLALGMTPEGWYCRYPMPLAKHGLAEIVNESSSDLQITGSVTIVRYERPEEIPSGRFFAKWRREDPMNYGREDPKGPYQYLAMAASGRGRLVGAMVTVYSRGWNCEGDDAIWVDGEEKPSIHGTGYEDFIGQGWGCKNYCHPLHGCTYGEHAAYYNHWSTFRLMLTEAVTFKKLLRMTIEDYVDWNDWSSVCYWYQELPVNDPFILQPLSGRLPHRYRDYWDKGYREAESVLEAAMKTDPRLSVVDEGLQDAKTPPEYVMYKEAANPGRPGTQGYPAHWSEEKAVAMRPGKAVNRFVVPFTVPKDGAYEVVLRMAPNVSQPKVAVLLDDPSEKAPDQGSVPPAEFVKKATLTAGKHECIIWVFDSTDRPGKQALVLDGVTVRAAEGK